MSKKIYGMLLFALLCSCQKPVESLTPTDSSPISQEEMNSIKLESTELERSDGSILWYQEDELNKIDFETTITYSTPSNISMSDKFSSVLQKRGFDTSIFIKNMDAVLENQNHEFIYGLKYVLPDAMSAKITLHIDGKENRFGYYCLGLIGCPSVKYRINYQEGDKSDFFYIWLPGSDCNPVFTVNHFDDLTGFKSQKEKYSLL